MNPAPSLPFLPKAFQNVSIIIAAFNETHSLRETVEIIQRTCQTSDIREIILAVSPRSTPACLHVCDELEQNPVLPIRRCVQDLPGAGGAYRDAFHVAQGSHLILMASDLETNPHDVHRIITAAKEAPAAVICTTRWAVRSSFRKGYNPVKLVANYFFQKIFRLLYHTDLTDLTFGYRLMPTILAKRIFWEETRHPFFLETIVKPLRLGIKTVEITTTWEPRQEGESQNSFWRNFLYFPIGFKTRFASATHLLQSS
jgi:glycosyltransferase involved in cell wall biosynthesis